MVTRQDGDDAPVNAAGLAATSPIDFLLQRFAENAHHTAFACEARELSYAWLLEQIRTAREDLGGQRLVGGRRAADRRGDVGVAQPQAVAGVDGRRLVGEPRVVERVEEPVAAAIAGEHAAGSVAAVGRRRQPDQEEAGVGIAEARQGPRPVGLATETPRRRRRHGSAMGDQAGAPPAPHDLRVQTRQRFFIVHDGRIVTR